MKQQKTFRVHERNESLLLFDRENERWYIKSTHMKGKALGAILDIPWVV